MIIMIIGGMIMNYKIYFSPTGGTKDVVDLVGEYLDISEDIDLSAEILNYRCQKNDICLIGVPSFGGRVPPIAIKRLQQIQGNQTSAILVVTYGNRAYEDTLKELKDTVEKQGFICVSAMAIVTKHSIAFPYGTGRPHQEDRKEIQEFTQVIKERLKNPSSIEVLGKYPYKEFHVSHINIITESSCNECGLCARKCPMQAISLDDPHTIDHEKCISCMRCVSICPYHAKICDHKQVENLVERLKPVCSLEKKNEFF